MIKLLAVAEGVAGLMRRSVRSFLGVDGVEVTVADVAVAGWTGSAAIRLDVRAGSVAGETVVSIDRRRGLTSEQS